MVFQPPNHGCYSAVYLFVLGTAVVEHEDLWLRPEQTLDHCHYLQPIQRHYVDDEAVANAELVVVERSVALAVMVSIQQFDLVDLAYPCRSLGLFLVLQTASLLYSRLG